ncbi:MAG: hypothetical protein ACLPZR_27495 [Solirubrobacteraceae bacterium]
MLAAVYVIVSPPSVDLAAHLFRAQLFRDEGFGIWDNLWYSGHDIVGYSVLFPAVAAALSPQLAGAIAATATAALFEPLARRHHGERAWLGAVLFGAATAIDLYTGRLTFAFGALPAAAAVLALDGGNWVIACALAALTALFSPVAALFVGLIGVTYAAAAVVSRRALRAALPGAALPGAALPGAALPGAALPGAAVATAALAPVAVLAIAFPEGGSEPFALSAMLPIALLAALGLAIVPREAVTLRAGLAVYALATIAAYIVPSPVGGNITRLGLLLAAPLAALTWRGPPNRLLALTLVPLIYLGWQAPVSDLWSTAGDPSTTAAYYQPLLAFLRRQSAAPAPPFRIEIPFTRSHWEAWFVASRYPIARGWERQLDIAENPIFYGDRLTAATYDAWLHRNAIRFVALPDAALDDSALREAALIHHGLSYLQLVMRSAHWRVYAVADPTPIVGGIATLRALGPDSLTLTARSPGTVVVRVHFSPYWALGQGAGCVAPAGPDTRVTLRRAGTARLVMRFSPDRIGAASPRCTPAR